MIYATPLGAGPLRLIAAAAGYPLSRFALAIFLGCLPYYFALAWFGQAIKLPAWVYAAVAGVLIGLALIQVLVRRGRRKGSV